MNVKQMILSIVGTLVMIVCAQPGISGQGNLGGDGDNAAILYLAAASIDINTADTADLTSLPGIGEKTAEKINAYREANGPFKSVDELLNVRGIGPKVLEKIRPLVHVS